MSTLQKLLWCEEYSEFCDEVVLVEGRFVLEKKHGECLCMVHAGLTATVVLIAEENVGSMSNHLKTVVVSKDTASNVEYLHLAHLFPLQNIKLSTRRHQEHRGEHVLRLRLSTGKTWYLELAEGRHREDRWREWLSWIQEVDERRHERRHHGRAEHQQDQRNSIPKNVEDGCGKLTVDEMKTRSPLFPEERSNKVITTVPTNARRESSDNTADVQASAWVTALAAVQNQKRREARAYHWVGHFQGALSRDHDGQILAESHDISELGLPNLDHSDHERNSHSHVSMKHGLSKKSRSIVMHPTSSTLVWGQHDHPHSVHVLVSSNSSTDTYSSLKDIESIGSLLRDSDMDWIHPLSDDINQKLLLCVGDLFQKFNIEAHGHGHVGRWRPMASLTAVDQLRDPDIDTSYRDSFAFPSTPEKEILYHHSSLPDILEGEASFLDDLHKTAEAVHRTSLVYMDLVNEDDTKKPHVINGRVMLLSPEQTRLLEEITISREMSHDLEFIIVRSRDNVATSGQERVVRKNPIQRHRRKTIGESLKERLHIGKTINQKEQKVKKHHQRAVEHHTKGILHTIKKVNISRREGIIGLSVARRRITSIQDVNPELLAIELTVIDSCLFVRVREAELVDCLWLKGDKHSRAPNTSKFIEFFERVVGLVSTEILTPMTVNARAATLAKCVQVAERCRLLQNFHSLKAVLSGMKVLPIYRLKKTWQVFEEDFPFEYDLWNELVRLMTDDGRCEQYKLAVEKSMRSPPCLPFFGVFIQRVVGLYSAVDRAGMRQRLTSQSSPIGGSLEQEVNSFTDDVITTSPSMIQSKPTNHTGFFGSFASAWRQFRHTPRRQSQVEDHPNTCDFDDSEKLRLRTTSGKNMTYARKAHIRRLIIGYAKQRAEEQGIQWTTGIDTKKDSFGAAIFAGFDGYVNWGNLFAKVQTTGIKTTPQKEEEEKKTNAENEMYETLFMHQTAAVQYRYKSNKLVKEYLMQTKYNTDEQNHRLSMNREPQAIEASLNLNENCIKHGIISIRSKP